MVAHVSPLRYFPAVPDGALIEVSVPANLALQQLTIAGSGAFTATVYRRGFTFDRRLITAVTSADDGATSKFQFTRPHGFRVGDWLRIAGNSNGYNGVWEILYSRDTLSAVLRVPYGAAGNDGTATLTRQCFQVTNDGYGKTRLWFAPNASGPASHLLSEGDTITVSGSTVGGYNTTHVVLAVNMGANTIDTSVAYTVDAAGCLVELATDAAQKPALEIFPATAHTGNVVRLTDSVGRPVALSTQRRASSEERIYILLATGGGALNYHVSVAGQTPRIG